jgi:hypothetical protein
MGSVGWIFPAEAFELQLKKPAGRRGKEIKWFAGSFALTAFTAV